MCGPEAKQSNSKWSPTTPPKTTATKTPEVVVQVHWWWEILAAVKCYKSLKFISRLDSDRALFILPVITAHHGGQFESLCDCNCGRWGLELSTEPSLHYYCCALGQFYELKGLWIIHISMHSLIQQVPKLFFYALGFNMLPCVTSCVLYDVQVYTVAITNLVAFLD